MSALLVASCLLGSLLWAPTPGTPGEVGALALLAEGAEPRRALVLAHRPGWSQRARLSLASEVETVSGAETRTEYGPEVVVPLRLDLPAWGRGEGGVRPRSGPGLLEPPDPWAAEDVARYRLRVGRPEVHAVDEDGMEEALRLAEALQGLSGRVAEVALASTGALVESRVDLRGGVSPRLAVLLGEGLSPDWLATPRFPAEPVGPGARWTVARAHGPETFSVITYELVELRGPHGRVRFQLQSRRPGGAPVHVARGELRFDLRRPLPERMEVVFSASAPSSERGAGRRVERRTRVTLEAGGLRPLSQPVRVAMPP